MGFKANSSELAIQDAERLRYTDIEKVTGFGSETISKLIHKFLEHIDVFIIIIEIRGV